MERAHWLWCGGGLLALVVVLLVAGVPAVSALLIAALLIAVLLACPLIVHRTTRSSSGQSPADRHQPTPARLSPSQMPVDKERSLR